MAHHKRGRPKKQRGGCLYCKPHKANGCEYETPSVQRRLQDSIEDLAHEESRTEIDQELVATYCNKPGCDCQSEGP